MMQWIAISGLLLLAACADHNRRCDGPLRPVNVSAAQPASAAAAAP
jgi:uncharacterized lipoprotein YmbA